MTWLLARLYDEPPTTLVEWIVGYGSIAVGLALLARWAVARWRGRDLRAGEPVAARVPVDEWRRRGLGLRAGREVVELQAGQRCPVCHDEHGPSRDVARCDACGALTHVRCAQAVGRCAALACAGRAVAVEAVRRA